LPMTSAKIYSRLLLLILGVSLLLFLSGARLRDLTYPDELRYVEVAREMLESGDWALPHFNYEIYPDKPPVFFWMLAAGIKGFGENTISAILPTSLSALLTLLVTFLLGRELFDERIALAGVWVLATFLLFLVMAQMVRMDMTLTLLVTLSLTFFVRILRDSNHQKQFRLAAYLALGLALITKGPVGLLIPAITLTAYLTLNRQFRRIKRLVSVPGLLILVAIPLLWLIPAGLEGGRAYLLEILLKQSAGRVVSSFSHARPFYYYLVVFPILFLPWSFFLLLFLDQKVRDDLSRDRSEIRFLLCWVIGTLLFFSLISGKIVVYLLPLTPGLALLIARGFTPLMWGGGGSIRWLKVSGFLLAGTGWTAATGLILSIPGGGLALTWPTLWPILLILTGGSTIILTLCMRMQVKKGFIAIGILGILLTASVTHWAFPAINARLSLKPMAMKILTLSGDRPRVGGYKVDLRYLSFYLHVPYRKLNTPGETKRFVQEDGTILIADLQDLPQLKTMSEKPLREVGRFRLKQMVYLLLTAREEPVPPAE